jgi:hypothetical protein
MTPLDAERNADIIRSTIPFRRVDWLLVKAPLASSCVFNYNISEKQRVRRILFSCNWATPAVYSTNVANSTIAANAYSAAFTADVNAANTVSSYKAPLSYFPDIWTAL